MGDFGAGKLALGLVIYFVALMSVFFVVEWAAATYGFDTTYSGGGNASALSFDIPECIEPRGFVNPDSNVFEEVSTFATESVDCVYTKNSYDASTCDSYAGCSYENDTFLWWTTGASCDGAVNLTYYGINGTTSVWTEFSGTGSLAENLLNQSNCELFGFTWGSLQDLNEVGFDTVLGLIGDFFALNVTLTDNTLLDVLLNLVMFYIPFIALLIAIYFAIPFFH